MTNMPEAKLAREAEICYATLALSTDYDCWKEEEHVDVGAVIATIKKNVANARAVVRDVMTRIGSSRNCPCSRALEGAIMTDLSTLSEDLKKRFEPVAGRYFV